MRVGGFFVHLYFYMFLLPVYEAVAPRSSAIVKLGIFIF